MDTVRINLLSGPRNISTALMYSFSQRKDCKVYDEPLYAHYLSNSNAREYHPGAEETLLSLENDGNKVVKMMQNANDKPVIFFKNMSHHLLQLDRTFMKGMVNVILTRDPKEMLLSFAKVIPNPTMADVGYALHLDLLKSLRGMGAKVMVLNARKVLEDPEQTLRKLCVEIGVPFDVDMLQWPKGPIPEDGIWARYWYKGVHDSTKFKPYIKKTEPFPTRLSELLKECNNHYSRLLKECI